MEEEMGFDGDSEKKKKKKWEGKVSANLKTPTADQVFQLLLHDFFNLHKWFPTLTTSYGIHGVSGQPGCIRYCAGSRIRIPPSPSSSSSSIDSKSNGGGDNNNEDDHDERKKQVVVNWCTERLLGFDSVERSFSYEIVDGNIGFNSYISTMKVSMPSDDGNGTGTGCMIEWSFELDPMDGWKLEDLVSKYETGLQNMAHKIEDSFSVAN